MAKATTKSKQATKQKPANRPTKKEFDYADVFDATESVEEYSKIIDEVREGGGGSKSYIPYLSLKEGETAEIRFLHRNPVRFFQHREWDRMAKKGAGGWVNLTCTQKLGNCPICNKGSKALYKCAYLIVHVDAEQGPTAKLFVRGITDARLLESMDRKMAGRGSDLTKVNFEVERIGKKTDTRYTFERTDVKAMPVFDRSIIKDAKNEEQYLEFLRDFFKPRKDKMEEIASMKVEEDDDSSDEESDNIPF